MILESTYFSNWQNNRINFILSKYPKEFFKGKRILELGAYNGYIGAYFNSIGADVLCVEGRQENVDKIKLDYPNVKVECSDLDCVDWDWGHYDIIINFGLYYHLEKFHKEHLENCINNCDLMFFESVIYDSFESEIYFRGEDGIDQSISMKGGTPSTSYVEDIFVESGILYEKFNDSKLNDGHHYDWMDTNSKKLDEYARRFWIVKHK
jgi:hypothetical protein